MINSDKFQKLSREYENEVKPIQDSLLHLCRYTDKLLRYRKLQEIKHVILTNAFKDYSPDEIEQNCFVESLYFYSLDDDIDYSRLKNITLAGTTKLGLMAIFEHLKKQDESLTLDELYDDIWFEENNKLKTLEESFDNLRDRTFIGETLEVYQLLYGLLNGDNVDLDIDKSVSHILTYHDNIENVKKALLDFQNIDNIPKTTVEELFEKYLSEQTKDLFNISINKAYTEMTLSSDRVGQYLWQARFLVAKILGTLTNPHLQAGIKNITAGREGSRLYNLSTNHSLVSLSEKSNEIEEKLNQLCDPLFDSPFMLDYLGLNDQASNSLD